jgi:uncharacterized protein with HEPN domain
MLESIRGIEKAIAGKTFRDYERFWVLRSALERGIEVISEASRQIIWNAVKDDLPALKKALLAIKASLTE